MYATKTIWNADAIVSVKLVDFREIKNLQYQPFKKAKWFWNSDQLEGFYGGCFDGFWSIETLKTKGYWETTVVIKDNKVYYRPYVQVIFANDKGYCKKFDTYKDASEYADKIIKQGIPNQIEIIQ